jgi:N-acetylmuramic acid 6-phosphate etherase
MATHTKKTPPAWLGIDCGGTRSVAAYECGEIRKRLEGGPGNLRMLSDSQLLALYRSLAKIHDGLPEPAAITIGMASARLESDRQRIRDFAAKVWPNTPCYATDDLETALAGGELDARDSGEEDFDALIITLAGTGSCFFGKTRRGDTAKVGGWGNILGDDGSAYEIGLRAMRLVLRQYDRAGEVPKLGQRLLRALMLNKPEEMSAWTVHASKSDVAALAVEVANAAAAGDKTAKELLDYSAASIAEQAIKCARRLTAAGNRVRFVFAGSVLLRNNYVAKRAAKLVRQQWKNASVATLKTESAWGAVELAKRVTHSETRSADANKRGKSFVRGRAHLAVPSGGAAAPPYQYAALDLNLASSPTEQRNPRSMALDKLSSADAIELFLNEDEKIPRAIRKEARNIERALGWITKAFKSGGRLFYVGAGTSGRLGVLDASECPPTFRSDPELVQCIIAGGQSALWKAVEGAEDDPDEGARAIQVRGVMERDVVVGIAASGRTPFVWGALIEAKRRRAKTVLLTFNPFLNIPAKLKPSLVVAPNVGPEILTGSTRLKSGTATKLVLNIFTTLAMVRTGKVLSNLMVDVKPSNVKLRDRAVRIVRALTNADETAARDALEHSGWVIKTAVARLARGRLKFART